MLVTLYPCRPVGASPVQPIAIARCFVAYDVGPLRDHEVQPRCIQRIPCWRCLLHGGAVSAALPGGVWYVPCTAGAGTTEGAYQEGWNACIKAMLAAPVQQAAPAGDARYRLLEPGWDKIEASDEFLSEDSVTWGVDPRGVFVGMVYQGGALLPARRRIDAAIASQQP